MREGEGFEMLRRLAFEARILRLVFCFNFIWFSRLGIASFEEDPIKATQSKIVPVTKELLTREGEPGPASPTYKIPDTSGFLVKKPYREVDKEKLDRKIRGAPSDLWDDWLFLEDVPGGDSSSEPIDEK